MAILTDKRKHQIILFSELTKRFYVFDTEKPVFTKINDTIVELSNAKFVATDVMHDESLEIEYLFPKIIMKGPYTFDASQMTVMYTYPTYAYQSIDIIKDAVRIMDKDKSELTCWLAIVKADDNTYYVIDSNYVKTKDNGKYIYTPTNYDIMAKMEKRNSDIKIRTIEDTIHIHSPYPHPVALIYNTGKGQLINSLNNIKDTLFNETTWYRKEI